MAKRKHAKEEEFYRGKIREQEKTIRSLQRRIKQLERTEHFREKIEPILEIKETKLSICSHCHQGLMENIFVAGRTFQRCSECGQRTPARKL